jgi:hypothetical protein
MHLSFPSGFSPVRLRVPCTSPSPRSLLVPTSSRSYSCDAPV